MINLENIKNQIGTVSGGGGGGGGGGGRVRTMKFKHFQKDRHLVQLGTGGGGVVP